MIELNINGQLKKMEVDPNMPLLWALRDVLQLTGSKFGCGAGLCGACTVHIDGEPMRACALPVKNLSGKKITTIEGLSADAAAGVKLHAVQQAWIDERVPQCGYCQCGQIMSAVALLKKYPKPSDAQIDQFMSGNLCRCGTYPRIRAAIKRAAGLAPQKNAAVMDTLNALAATARATEV